MNPITILLAEDHRIIRDGVRELLLSESDLKVIAEAENGSLAVSLTDQLHPDVVIMDVSMPLINGIEAARQIMKSASKTKVLMFSSHSDDLYIQQAKAFGAAGYLVKQTDMLQLADAIRAAHHGDAFICPSKPTQDAAS
ncbi:response regulator transcription factor [Prosthecobacter sp.]|uniref:response regulator n=1 Tax=Prosthecobacter sp. TaxID=1965333 RepID=UPI002488B8C8|nr:response regulator transcription factor [Prosthecobacter sp.]MDI1312085.1 response regulator transcription factor [Prosthecobacter sp.]